MNDAPSPTAWRRVLTACGSAGPADVRNQLRFGGLCLLWGLFFLAAVWLLRGNPDLSPLLVVAAIALPGAMGIVVIRAYLHFLRNTDEMLRKIQLEALAIAFGVYALLSMTYPLLEAAGLVLLEIGDLFAIVMITWAVAQLYGTWRYR